MTAEPLQSPRQLSSTYYKQSAQRRHKYGLFFFINSSKVSQLVKKKNLQGVMVHKDADCDDYDDRKNDM